MRYLVAQQVPSELRLDRYQQQARRSDQNREVGGAGLRTPLLGLFGEVGSLLTLPKRVKREKPTYENYRDGLLEELGDVLWYLANLASRNRIPLSALAKWRAGALHTSPAVPDAQLTFTTLDKRLSERMRGRRTAFQDADFFSLGATVGRLMHDWASGEVWGLDHRQFTEHLGASFFHLQIAAAHSNISLNEAAANNLAKIESRWPAKRVFSIPPQQPRNAYESLPQSIEMYFEERTINRKPYVYQRCNGINIGDRLTDNKLEKDDYRFHDVFHLSYATFLGWSPVLRALFKVKRKSNPELDENQDGARAILIEEGIATWIFNHGLRNHHFRYSEKIDYSLLKAIRHFVSGYEVEKCHLWQWEMAILRGFQVFRQLRSARQGLVTADLARHRLTFRRTSPRQHK